MKAASILIFATALVSSYPIYSSKAQEGIASTAKVTQKETDEKDEYPCGQSNGHCLRMSSLGKAQVVGRFGSGGLGKKAMDKVSGAVKSLKTLIDTRKARNDF